ncbi:protein FAM43A-like [Panonychus citri]|uniref:protein FAM43A-like n=1 Tax=Panonychus citri TaxID=50023 RepID=UPI0023075B33|nr:protein FAM43A-like [Panonychus citri]XP_053205673.1 protein FAM43A-like [Panonychus citri]
MWLRRKVKTTAGKKEKVAEEVEEEKRRSSLCSKLKKMVLKSSEKSFGLNNVQLKFWSTRKSLTITDYDPVYKVIYLGNVLTLWAKGDGAIDKPLSTLWKNYCSNVKHDIFMKLTICNSGLKAITREHGLTEYWSNRITYAATHPDHPKVFCWIYRHVGRKMKQELRCHAVLCSKESKAKEMAEFLNKRLITALQEFRREKKYRQNFRLSLASSCQEIPLIPLRKQLLIKGLANFRQPLERSKSAPKLTSIEEILEEPEDVEEEDETEEEGSLEGTDLGSEEDAASDTTINILRMIF